MPARHLNSQEQPYAATAVLGTPGHIYHGGGAHAAQVSADVVLEFSLACSSAARAGDVSARERSADDSVILWSGSVSGA